MLRIEVPEGEAGGAVLEEGSGGLEGEGAGAAGYWEGWLEWVGGFLVGEMEVWVERMGQERTDYISRD